MLRTFEILRVALYEPRGPVDIAQLHISDVTLLFLGAQRIGPR
jgi:hypothetical protein